MKLTSAKLIKIILLFGFVGILLIINAKINIKLQTTKIPKHLDTIIPGCRITNNANNPNNSNDLNDSNGSKNPNSSNNSMVDTSTDRKYNKYLNDSDYNKFYWGNN